MANVTVQILLDNIRIKEDLNQICDDLEQVKQNNLIIEDCDKLIARTPQWMNPQTYIRFSNHYTKLRKNDIISKGAMFSIGGPDETELRPTNGEGAGSTPDELNDGNTYFNPLGF